MKNSTQKGFSTNFYITFHKFWMHRFTPRKTILQNRKKKTLLSLILLLIIMEPTPPLDSVYSGPFFKANYDYLKGLNPQIYPWEKIT